MSLGGLRNLAGVLGREVIIPSDINPAAIGHYDEKAVLTR
jgi:hypothetical protein